MSMHTNSSACLMGTHDHSSLQLSHTAVDSVLSAAHDASCTLRHLLNCPCRASLQVQLLLAVIYEEVITSYRRVIGTYHQISDRVTDNLPDAVQQAEDCFLLKRVPVLVGNHHLEDDMEKMLIGHVLTKRLNELEELIGEITQCVGQLEAARGAQSRIHSFLTFQLGAAQRELADLQRDESNVGDDVYSR